MPEEQNLPAGEQQQPVPEAPVVSQPEAVPVPAPVQPAEPAATPVPVAPVAEQAVQPEVAQVPVQPAPVQPEVSQPVAAVDPNAVVPAQPVPVDPNAVSQAQPVAAAPVAEQPAAPQYQEIIPGVTIVSAPVAVDAPGVPAEPTIPPPVAADPNTAPAATVVAPPVPVAEPAMPAEQPVAAADGAKKKVLIVEDERPLAHALELKLGHDGYETTVAPTGLKGLEEASSGKYDLMLLDLILPELDGFELLRQLREKESTIPVVILSNLGQEEDKKRVEDYNVAQYCVKSNMPLSAIVNTVKVLTT